MQILNFGSLNIDFVYDVDHFVKKGETLSSLKLETFCGGKGLNQSIALAKAGAPVFHAGAIGTDGEMLLDALKNAGVNTDRIMISPDHRTGNAIIQVDKDGDNCILLYGGSNQNIRKEYMDEVLEHFDRGDYLLLQNEINHMPYLIQQAHQKGMKIILNPSPFNEELRKANLEWIDCFVLNEIEALQILEREELPEVETELATRLRERFPNAEIVLTLGEKGSIYADAQELIRQPVFPVKAVDTTAAGDTFTGYFLAQKLQGKSNAQALEMAAKAAAIAVSKKGAATSIPEQEEVEKSMLGQKNER